MNRRIAAHEPPSSGIRRSIYRQISAHADTRAVRLLRRCLEAALYYLHAEDYDCRTNGEGFVLDCLATEAHTIVDVGANRGDWALEAARRCPRATIYCFELASATRSELFRRTQAEPRIRVGPTGLSSRSATVGVKHYPAEPAWTSIHDYPHDKPSVWLEEAVTTGDAFLREAGLTKVDFLKIDTEGHELAVLHGFRVALEQRAIRVIQFEYGYAAIVSHGLLLDFYDLLEPLGYVIGRLRRNTVEFAPYRFIAENFLGPNFVAVRSEEHEILARLTGRFPARR